MKNIFSQTVGATRALGVASFLASGPAQSDEAVLPPGTVLGEFPASSIPTLQSNFVTQLVSDITPDPSLLPSNTFRWLLVKTESGLELTLPENYSGNAMHFGQQEKFFVRFDGNTGLPQISFDLQNWQPYTAGTPVNISREEQTTILNISNTLQTLNTLQAEQQILTTTLAAQQGQLEQVQDELTGLQGSLALTDYELAITESDLSDQEATRNTLETAMRPEVKLRTDTHPVAANTTLDDAVKNTSIQSALNTYDSTAPAMQSMQMKSFSLQSSTGESTAALVIPTSSEVQSTITVLTSELSRIQTQINTVNSQITAKQSEIDTTQNNINSLQQTIDILNAQINEYTSTYYYWDDEYDRLDAIMDDIIADIGNARQGFDNAVYTLRTEGSRNDVPDNVDDPNIAAQVDILKSRISTEAVNLANSVPANLWGNDTSTKGKSTYTSTTYIRVGGEYYYKVYYSTTGGYPATIKMYIKPTGSSSFGLSTKTYTAYNYTHRMAIINQTVLPFNAKSCDYALADKKLETYQEQYVELEIDRDTTRDDRRYALDQKDNAWSDLYTANDLATQRNAEKNTLITQKSTLTTQKSQLESLKNTKATLQTLYARVKSIIDQLKQHVASHGVATQEIANLIALAQVLEDEIADLELLIGMVEGDAGVIRDTIGTIEEDITSINTSLTQREEQLLAILNTLSTIIPQDSFSRNGTILNPASEALKFFGDGYRTGYFSTTLGGLSAKFVTQYEWTKGINDIYPAYGSMQYIVGGRAYRTDGQRMNNFAHKELVNGYNAEAVTKLNNCIALLNQYPAGFNDGIENFLSAVKMEITKLKASTSTNTTIKNHDTMVNDFTKKALLQGGSYALFEQLVGKNPAFSLKIEEITTLMAQKGNISEGSDAMNDLRHMVTSIFAQVFAERLMNTGTDGLDLYDHWEQEALSFIGGLGGTTTLDSEFDMNADWSVDAHGNKYKFGLYHPGGANNSLFDPHATLFMVYSPDGTNTQVLGPVQVSSGEEADAMKARWKEELLKMKRMHVDYNGGEYDLFRGADEKGENIYWGKYIINNQTGTLGFGRARSDIEKQIQYRINSFSDSAGATLGIQNFFLPLNTFGNNILQNTQLIPGDYILYYGEGSSKNKTTFLPGEKKETFYINGGDFNSPEYKSFPFIVRVRYDINSQGTNYPAVVQFEYKTSNNNISQYTLPQVVNNFAQKEYTIWVQKQQVIDTVKAEAGFTAPQYENDFINWPDLNSVDANNHYREGSGKSIRIPIARLNLAEVKLKDFPLIGEILANREAGNHQILDSRQSLELKGDDWWMLGNITLKFVGEAQITSTGWHVIGEIKSFDDLYNFDASTRRGILGELLTIIGSKTEGIPYYIQIRGSIPVDKSGNF